MAGKRASPATSCSSSVPDHGSGAALGPFKAESLGIGPAVSYSTDWGHTPISFTAKWEHDFAATNTFEGDMVTTSLTVGL